MGDITNANSNPFAITHTSTEDLKDEDISKLSLNLQDVDGIESPKECDNETNILGNTNIFSDTLNSSDEVPKESQGNGEKTVSKPVISPEDTKDNDSNSSHKNQTTKLVLSDQSLKENKNENASIQNSVSELTKSEYFPPQTVVESDKQDEKILDDKTLIFEDIIRTKNNDKDSPYAEQATIPDEIKLNVGKDKSDQETGTSLQDLIWIGEENLQNIEEVFGNASELNVKPRSTEGVNLELDSPSAQNDEKQKNERMTDEKPSTQSNVCNERRKNLFEDKIHNSVEVLSLSEEALTKNKTNKPILEQENKNEEMFPKDLKLNTENNAAGFKTENDLGSKALSMPNKNNAEQDHQKHITETQGDEEILEDKGIINIPLEVTDQNTHVGKKRKTYLDVISQEIKLNKSTPAEAMFEDQPDYDQTSTAKKLVKNVLEQENFNVKNPQGIESLFNSSEIDTSNLERPNTKFAETDMKLEPPKIKESKQESQKPEIQNANAEQKVMGFNTMSDPLKYPENKILGDNKLQNVDVNEMLPIRENFGKDNDQESLNLKETKASIKNEANVLNRDVDNLINDKVTLKNPSKFNARMDENNLEQTVSRVESQSVESQNSVNIIDLAVGDQILSNAVLKQAIQTNDNKKLHNDIFVARNENEVQSLTQADMDTDVFSKHQQKEEDDGDGLKNVVDIINMPAEIKGDVQINGQENLKEFGSDINHSNVLQKSTSTHFDSAKNDEPKTGNIDMGYEEQLSNAENNRFASFDCDHNKSNISEVSDKQTEIKMEETKLGIGDKGESRTTDKTPRDSQIACENELQTEGLSKIIEDKSHSGDTLNSKLTSNEFFKLLPKQKQTFEVSFGGKSQSTKSAEEPILPSVIPNQKQYLEISRGDGATQDSIFDSGKDSSGNILFENIKICPKQEQSVQICLNGENVQNNNSNKSLNNCLDHSSTKNTDPKDQCTKEHLLKVPEQIVLKQEQCFIINLNAGAEAVLPSGDKLPKSSNKIILKQEQSFQIDLSENLLQASTTSGLEKYCLKQEQSINLTDGAAESQEPLIKSELEEELEKRSLLYEITKKNLFTIVIGALFYMLDVYSDLALGIEYFVKHEWIYAALTLFFVIGSSIFYNFFNPNATWRRVDRQGLFWVWITPYFVLNGQPIVQYVKNFKIVRLYLKCREESDIQEQINTHKKFIRGYKKAAALKNDETLWEAIPQTMIQLYVLISRGHNFDLKTLIFQLVALSTSTFGLISTRFSYHEAFHLMLGEKVSVIGRALMATGYGIPLFCRAISISACMSKRPIYCIVVLGLQWAGGTIWWLFYGWDTRGLNSLAEGLGLMLQPSYHTPFQCFISSAILFTSDVILMTLWFTAIEQTQFWVIVFGTILDLEFAFRIVSVLYWKYKCKFINKVL